MKIENKNKIYSILLPIEIYSIESIRRTMHDLKNKEFKIDLQSNNNTVKVTVKGEKINYATINKIKEQFLENQIRIDLENEFGVLRNIIVAQAFEPCTDLKKILSLLDNEK